jgi:hypothetical protein
MPRNAMSQVTQDILTSSADIRYAALYRNGQLVTVAKAAVAGASSSESDKYEELLVNPSVLKLVTQRGNIDCGGARFVLIRYGNFFQWIHPIRGGHVSICIEPDSDPLRLSASLEEILRRHDLL